jgi:hypothetical protein
LPSRAQNKPANRLIYLEILLGILAAPDVPGLVSESLSQWVP